MNIPQILPRNAGNAHELFQAAMRDGKALWTNGRVIVVCREQPYNKTFKRMAAINHNTDPEAA